jgi:hypothetical protein
MRECERQGVDEVAVQRGGSRSPQAGGARAGGGGCGARELVERLPRGSDACPVVWCQGMLNYNLMKSITKDFQPVAYL